MRAVRIGYDRHRRDNGGARAPTNQEGFNVINTSNAHRCLPVRRGSRLGRACRRTVALATLAAAFGTASAQPETKRDAKAQPRKATTAACRPGESSFFRDEALGMKVSTKLQFNKALLREKMQVKVSGGVATLSGGVSSPELIATAVSLASQVEGISCVNNLLKVGPATTDAPAAPGG
jgi:hypothetical protein